MATDLSRSEVPRVVGVRGQLVVLASNVAVAVETRQVVQSIKNNPLKLPAKYAFELSDAEEQSLRPRGMISKPGRGGVEIGVRLLAMIYRLEPNAVVGLLPAFCTARSHADACRR
jgi:hypothetical protein